MESGHSSGEPPFGGWVQGANLPTSSPCLFLQLVTIVGFLGIFYSKNTNFSKKQTLASECRHEWGVEAVSLYYEKVPPFFGYKIEG